MKWIKTFENHFKKTRKEIQEDLANLTIDLVDNDIEITLNWEKNGFKLMFRKESEIGYQPFNVFEISDKCLTIIDYVKSVYPDYKYELKSLDKLIDIEVDRKVVYADLYFTKPVNEGFGYTEEDYIIEVTNLLKQFNLRPIQINHLLDFYQEMIEEYMNDGKVPKLLVDELSNKLDLGKGGFPSMIFPKINSTIKNL